MLNKMRYLKVFTLLGIFGLCLVAIPSAHAQSVAIGVGVGPAYVAPPVCAYGYYPYYPYACAPYGYYGPEWFSGGVFIGAGPWFHGFYGRPGHVVRPGFSRAVPTPGRAFVAPRSLARGPVGGFRGGFRR